MLRRMAEHPTVTFAFLLALFAIGSVVGTATSGLLAPMGLVAQDRSCEQDECSGWWVLGACESNVGHATGCDFHDGWWIFDTCETFACED